MSRPLYRLSYRRFDAIPTFSRERSWLARQEGLEPPDFEFRKLALCPAELLAPRSPVPVPPAPDGNQIIPFQEAFEPVKVSRFFWRL